MEHPNPWDCNDDNITFLFQLLQSGLVTDSNQVQCANGTLVRDLDIFVEGIPLLDAVDTANQFLLLKGIRHFVVIRSVCWPESLNSC